ncbi:MAG: class I SAM-dependent methyltransferase [Spirochaetales bacterium]|nr:class I SAM-dependent methyltransferase [Spirochaetales bacterium]
MRRKDRIIDADMRLYYDAIAGGYERVYAGADADASLFGHDAAAVGALLPGLVGKRHLDLACGTGFWLRFYHPSCESVVLVDRSERMLDECRKNVAALGIAAKASLKRADLFAPAFPAGTAFDSVLLGFIVSHLSPAEENSLFTNVRGVLVSGARFILIDSIRAAGRKRETIQRRTLPDGGSFRVRKRYLDEEELEAMGKRNGVSWRALFHGKAFILAEGEFMSPFDRLGKPSHNR